MLSAPKKVLVTGGAGFLGSHVCKKLIEQNIFVIALDNFNTGFEENIQDLIKNPNFKLIHHDVCDPIDLNVNEVYHLACPASPPHYQKDPVYTLKTNFYGSQNMINLAIKNNAKILFTSTSEVYGDPKEHPQSETYWGYTNPIGIRSCYDEGKRVSEALFFAHYRKHKIDMKIIRIFNTYGPNMHPQDGRVISNFINQAIKGNDLTIYGKGKQTRSFCYVDDMVAGIFKMMNSSSDFIGPVNMGNPIEFTIEELAHTVMNLSNSKSRISYKPLPQDDPQQRKPDITKAKKHLNWEPKVELEDGLKKTIRYFENLKESKHEIR